MDTLVVQIGVKHGRVAELARSRDARLSVGRGYDNDLVLTDQHIAARQLEFRREDDQWHMRVLDHTNPVLLNSKKISSDSTPVNSGDQVTIGRTRLSLYSADHPVEHTRKLVLSNWLALENTGLVIPILVLLGVSLLDLGLNYFEGSTDLRWEEYAYSILFSGVIVVLWAGIWAIAGRILRHQHHYGLQLMATASVSLLATMLALLGTYLAYPFHSVTVSELFDWLSLLIVLIILFHLNLLIATNTRNTLVVATALAVVVTSVSYAFVMFGDDDEDFYIPSHSYTLLPPAFQLFAGATAGDYFARVALEARQLEKEE